MTMHDPQTILAAVLHRLAAAEARITKLEGVEGRHRESEDALREARAAAQQMNVNPDVIDAGPADERKKVAGVLRGRGWSYQEIAHVMGCSERTIERYFAPEKPHKD